MAEAKDTSPRFKYLKTDEHLPAAVETVVKEIQELMMDDPRDSRRYNKVPNMPQEFLCSKVIYEKDKMMSVAGENKELNLNLRCYEIVIPFIIETYEKEPLSFLWAGNVISFCEFSESHPKFVAIKIKGNLAKVKNRSTGEREWTFFPLSNNTDLMDLPSKPLKMFLKSPLVFKQSGHCFLSGYKMTISWLRGRLHQALNNYRESKQHVKVIPTIKQKDGGPLFLRLEVEDFHGVEKYDVLVALSPAIRVSRCQLAVPAVPKFDQIPSIFENKNIAKQCLWKIVTHCGKQHYFSDFQHKRANVVDNFSQVTLSDFKANQKESPKPSARKPELNVKTMYKNSIDKKREMTSSQRQLCQQCANPASRMLLEYYFKYGYIPDDEMNEVRSFVWEILNFLRSSMEEHQKPNDPKILKFVESGSVSEHLKVVQPDEFDIMIAIDLPGSTDSYTFVEDDTFPPGFAICKVKRSKSFSRELKRCFQKSDEFGHCIAPEQLAFGWLYGKLEKAINKFKMLKVAEPFKEVDVGQVEEVGTVIATEVEQVNMLNEISGTEGFSGVEGEKEKKEEVIEVGGVKDFNEVGKVQEVIEVAKVQEVSEVSRVQEFSEVNKVKEGSGVSNVEVADEVNLDDEVSGVHKVDEVCGIDIDKEVTKADQDQEVSEVDQDKEVSKVNKGWKVSEVDQDKEVSELETFNDVGIKQEKSKNCKKNELWWKADLKLKRGGPALLLEITPPKKSKLPPVISVDLVLALKLSKDDSRYTVAKRAREELFYKIAVKELKSSGEDARANSHVDSTTTDRTENDEVKPKSSSAIDSENNTDDKRKDLAMKNLKYLWRVSYSDQEKRYLQYVEETQQKEGVEGCQNICIMILKTICSRELLKQEDSVIPHKLSSYILKTALFHILANTNWLEDWKMQCLANRYVDLLNELSEWNDLQHFFINNSAKLMEVFPDDAWCKPSAPKNLLDELHATLKIQLFDRFDQISTKFKQLKRKIDKKAKESLSTSGDGVVDYHALLSDVLKNRDPEEAIHPPFFKHRRRQDPARRSLVKQQVEDIRVSSAARAERKGGPRSNLSRNIERTEEEEKEIKKKCDACLQKMQRVNDLTSSIFRDMVLQSRDPDAAIADLTNGFFC